MHDELQCIPTQSKHIVHVKYFFCDRWFDMITQATECQIKEGGDLNVDVLTC